MSAAFFKVLLTLALVWMCGYAVQILGERHYRDNTNLLDLGFLVVPPTKLFRGLDLVPLLLVMPAALRKREFWNNCAFLFLCRAVCIFLTILPHPPDAPVYAPETLDFIFWGSHDKLFSGHMCFVWTSARVTRQSLWKTCTLAIMAALILLAMRDHYSIDLFLGVLLSELTFRARIQWL